MSTEESSSDASPHTVDCFAAGDCGVAWTRSVSAMTVARYSSAGRPTWVRS
ncbi:hypothetical protein [Natrinema halophilum]|uniref:hypothetical protein n=1 Tax=Natrinema halophilum TaxID=1699371 RepID=UPI001F186A2B|nr:hypothetical protein [Natrinema halophilum]UHQ96088.1 hypothetical protein HYG82_22425 [Natrinema halophilum]